MADLRKGLDYADRPPPNAPGIEIEIGRLHAVREVQDRRHRAYADLVAQIEGWLTSLPPGTILELARIKPATTQTGESLNDAVARYRAEIESTSAVLEAVMAAPPPKAILKEQAARHVEALAKRGRPRLSAPNGELDVKFGDPGSFAPGTSASVTAMLAWLHGPAMVARLVAEIDKMPDNPNAMNAEQKAERIASLKGSLDDLERREEATIEAALAQGLDVLRRVDASPLAVLGVVPAKVKRKAA
jgi:hypothetical protein